MADVFISYKRDERPAVEEIAARLRALGLRVWFDAGLSAGESFNDEIDREARAAKLILVCWSPTARDSKWVKSEAMIGFEQDKLAAIHVAGPDGFSPPAPFNTVHAEDLRAWISAPSEAHAGWRSVLRRIGKLCARLDIESYGALDAQAGAAELRAWITAHEQSPLFMAVDAMLHAREAQDAERARLEQEARERRAREEAERRAREEAERARELELGQWRTADARGTVLDKHNKWLAVKKSAPPHRGALFWIVSIAAALSVLWIAYIAAFGNHTAQQGAVAELPRNEPNNFSPAEEAAELRDPQSTRREVTSLSPRNGISLAEAASGSRDQLVTQPETEPPGQDDGSSAGGPLSMRPSEPGSAELRASVARVVWTQRPSVLQVSQVYSSNAASSGVGGRVVLDCTVQPSLAVECYVASVVPEGVGFEQAALQLANSYRARATLLDGSSAIGQRTRIAINFQPPAN